MDFPSPEGQQRALGGSLYWVSADFLRLLCAMAQDIPAETKLEDLAIPDRSGLVVFEADGVLHTGKTGNPGHDSLALTAMTFSSTLLVDADRKEKPVPGMLYTFYGRYRRPDTGQIVWWPIGYESWDCGQPIPRRAMEAAKREAALGGAGCGSLHLFIAFVTLINQTLGIAEITTERAPRAAGRRSERRGLPSDVRIVRLRKLARRGSEPGGECSVDWTHRWLVKGHLRLQRVGSGLSERRLVYVRPHVKGPEDKPFILKQTVSAVVR